MTLNWSEDLCEKTQTTIFGSELHFSDDHFKSINKPSAGNFSKIQIDLYNFPASGRFSYILPLDSQTQSKIRIEIYPAFMNIAICKIDSF